jgi:putative transcriptional regulator
LILADGGRWRCDGGYRTYSRISGVGGVRTASSHAAVFAGTERDWSRAELAQRLEVSRQSGNAIETGKFDPSLTLAFKLSRLFGMRIEEIFSDEDVA